MIQQPNKKPKLRCSAAKCRALVPFGYKCAQELLSDGTPAQVAALVAARHLNQCYMALSSESFFAADVLKESSVKFAVQLVALTDWFGADSGWTLKPKLHLFLELCSEGSKPATFWCYRDEDYGGSVAKFSRRRGGVLSVQAFSRNCLERFKINQPIIYIK